MPPSPSLGRPTILVVDDEPLARRLVREYLAPHEGRFERVVEAADGLAALDAAASFPPGTAVVAFLDLRMPGAGGLEVAAALDPSVAVVFVTAHDDAAIRAFELSAVDYLLKPVSRSRFETALERALARVAVGERRSAPVASEAATRLVVRDGARSRVVPLEEIDALEAQDDYVAIRTAGREILDSRTLAAFEAMLDPRRFVRVHRSWIVAIDRIRELQPEGERKVAVLREGTRVPVSRSGRERLVEAGFGGGSRRPGGAGSL